MTWPISGPRARSYPAREYGQQPSSGTQPKRQSSPSIYKLHVNSPPTPGKPSPSTVPRQTQLRTATTTTTSNQNREHPPRRLPGERPSIGAEAATRGVPGGRPPGQILRAKPKHPRVRAWGDPGQILRAKPKHPRVRAWGDTGQILRAKPKHPRVRAWGDAGWLRGQTTRRRIHRRSDGGPERRQRCSDGGPEHRYEWYTATPRYVSRPNYECV